MKKSLLFLFTLLLALTVFIGCDDDSRLSGDFEIHFIDVGQADAALVLCEGKSMLIDGGNVADSGLMYTYLKSQGITHLDYLVATHPHEDHVGGLAGALNYATVGTVYCTTTTYDSDAFENFIKYVKRRNATITVPKSGNMFELGGASVQIISCNADEGTNNSSIVMRIVYGKTSFLFTGDAEREAEAEILSNGNVIESTVLKVGHHGSDTSTSYPFLREVMPKYAVISVGESNDYGHPTENVLSRLRDAEVTVYRTDMQGTVICKSDGKDVEFSVSKGANLNTLEEVGGYSVLGTAKETAPPTTEAPVTAPSVNEPPITELPVTEPSMTNVSYILNVNPSSLRFHYPNCNSVDKMKEENKKPFYGTRDEVIKMGYVPCGNCKP